MITMATKRVQSSSAKTAQTNAGQPDEKPKKKFNRALFEGGAAALLREHKVIPSEGEFREQWQYKQALDFFEIECVKAINDYEDAVTAINRFEMWLLDTDWTPEKPATFVINEWHITLTVTVPSGTVALGVDFVPLTENVDEAIKELKAQLAETFNRNWKVPQQKPQGQQTSGPQVKQVRVNGLRIQSKPNGKNYAFIMPAQGPWVTYGIPLYTDVANEMGIDIDLEAGEYEWEDERTIIKYETKPDSDKPSRVLGFLDE